MIEAGIFKTLMYMLILEMILLDINIYYNNYLQFP